MADALTGLTELTEDEDPVLASGDRVGRYMVLSSLGRGGMSVVFLAYDPELDRKVALKLMRVTMLGEKGKARLQREAQALAKLSHPNVVPVYDAGAFGEQAFVAMEFVEGKTLRTWLRERRSPRDVLAVMIDAGRGLAAAHAAGLVHRDFKPDNVVIGDDGRVRVLDFGLARLVSVLDGSEPSEGDGPPMPSPSHPSEEVTRADQIIGTPAYMAPEQIRRVATDERADQFSFCVTLYEALYGERPFDTTHATASSDAATASVSDVAPIARVPRPPPRGTAVPTWIQRVVARGLREDPSTRWPSMDALLRALTHDPWQRWRRAGAGAALLATLGGAAFAVVRAQTRTRALCSGGAEAVAVVWSPAARSDVARAFAATKVPYADAATRAVTSALDAHAAAWASMSDASCVATRVRGEQSPEALDLRAACLGDRLKEVTALVELLRHADVETVRQAARAAESLGPVSDCADVAALRARAPKPRDPAAAWKVEELERRLARLEANVAVGKATTAAELGDALLADAVPVGFGPLTAEVHLWRGRAYAELGNADKSIPAFRQAFAAALGSRADRVLRWAPARLAQEYIYARKGDEFDYWAGVASEALARGGADADLDAFLEHLRCVAMWTRGAIYGRLACLEAYTAKVERKRPLNDWELVTIGLAAGDTGELARGVEYLRRSYAASNTTNGPSHPRTLEMRGYLCKGLSDYGDLDAALAECEAALREATAVAGDNPAVVGRLRQFFGTTLRLLHRHDEAQRELELAKEHAAEPDEVLGELAMNASAQGRHGPALEFLRKALAEAEASLPPLHENVINAQVQLGEEQLDAGDFAAGREVLERAARVAGGAEMSPILRASLDFQLARALGGPSAAGTPARAVELATRARAQYLEHAPSTRLYREDIARVDAWLAQRTAPR